MAADRCRRCASDASRTGCCRSSRPPPRATGRSSVTSPSAASSTLLRANRFLWEDAVAAVPTVMSEPLDVAIPAILGTDAVLRGLRVRTAVTPEPVLLGDGHRVHRHDRRSRGPAADVQGARADHRRARGRTGRPVPGRQEDPDAGAAAGARNGSRLRRQPARSRIPPLPRRRACCRYCWPTPTRSPASRWTGWPTASSSTDRCARPCWSRRPTSTAISWSKPSMRCEAGAFDDGRDRRSRTATSANGSAYSTSGWSPGATRCPRWLRRRSCSRSPASSQHVSALIGSIGMKVVGALFKASRRRAAFVEALRVIATVDDPGERRLLLAETLDCCSHRFDAWVTSIASRRLADLRARTPDGAFLGAYGVIEHVRLSTPEPDGDDRRAGRAVRPRQRRVRPRPGTHPCRHRRGVCAAAG